MPFLTDRVVKRNPRQAPTKHHQEDAASCAARRPVYLANKKHGWIDVNKVYKNLREIRIIRGGLPKQCTNLPFNYTIWMSWFYKNRISQPVLFDCRPLERKIAWWILELARVRAFFFSTVVSYPISARVLPTDIPMNRASYSSHLNQLISIEPWIDFELVN